MTDRELMQQALEALTVYDGTNGESRKKRVLAALRERLAQPEQEPVLETVYETIIQWDEGGGKRSRRELARRIVALYTTTQPEQEPVANIRIWHKNGEQHAELWNWDKGIETLPDGNYDLYTHPPQRKPLSPQSPCEMTQAERKMFRLGWLECEAAHGIKEKNA